MSIWLHSVSSDIITVFRISRDTVRGEGRGKPLYSVAGSQPVKNSITNITIDPNESRDFNPAVQLIWSADKVGWQYKIIVILVNIYSRATHVAIKFQQ